MLDSDQFDAFAHTWLPRLETEMVSVLSNQQPAFMSFYGMMNYQMGWVDEAFQPGDFAMGKHIRPLLCLMACEAVGGNPKRAVPAAAAIEILHNFSLVHDDIEDGDEVRRHRPTMWKVWGIPQAVNAGDGMFALAYQSMLRLPSQGTSPGTTLAVLEHFTQTCIKLTEGQYLDLKFESRHDVTVDEYLEMIGGKTAALIAASLAIGALVGGADDDTSRALYNFGHNLGLAFQIQDDILGIWGNPSVTGKAAGNDLLRQKKSLPILYALRHPKIGPQLQKMWIYPIGSKQLPVALQLMAAADARTYAEQKVRDYYDAGVAALVAALGTKATTSPLMALADELAERQM